MRKKVRKPVRYTSLHIRFYSHKNNFKAKIKHTTFRLFQKAFLDLQSEQFLLQLLGEFVHAPQQTQQCHLFYRY